MKKFIIGDDIYFNLSEEELILKKDIYSKEIRKDRLINSKIANFMGWNECFDKNEICINQVKFYDIVGNTYYSDGYNPLRNPEQYMKAVFKLIELGFMVGFDNFNDGWEIEISPTENVTIPFCGHAIYEEDKDLGRAICLAICRLLGENIEI